MVVQAEELLSLTEQFVDQMPQADRDRWLRLSAEVADMREEEDYKPCVDCGVYPGDPHNPEAHLAEMRAAEYAMYEPRDPYDAPYGDEVLLDPEECAREHGHSYNTHTRNGMMYCTDCETELGIVCKAIVSVERYGEGPCGLLADHFLHVNKDDSRAIDHEYVPDIR